MSAPTPKFWAGVCGYRKCRKPYVRWSSKRPGYCNDACRRYEHRERQRDEQHRKHGANRSYAEQQAEYVTRQQHIAARIKSGELTPVPGNCCPTCYHAGREAVVETGTDALTGRTWERCGCGFKYIGRWAA